MNLKRLKERMAINANLTFDLSQSGSFWKWKANVEEDGKRHILDKEHINETSNRILDIVPGWQTYRGADCNYQIILPRSLKNIQHAYDQIRTFSLLDFDKVPVEPLEKIWHELGRVKEPLGKRNAARDYFVIAVCKPLMFLWGQTPPLDSINRREMRKGIGTLSSHPTAGNHPSSQFRIPKGNRWDFSSWYKTMLIFQKELNGNPDIIRYCKKEAKSLLGKASVIPWGRFLDIYYFKAEFDEVFKETFLDIWYEKSKDSWNTSYIACNRVGQDMLFWLYDSDPAMYYEYYVSAAQEARASKRA